jgi:hypothetical protein
MTFEEIEALPEKVQMSLSPKPHEDDDVIGVWQDRDGQWYRDPTAWTWLGSLSQTGAGE